MNGDIYIDNKYLISTIINRAEQLYLGIFLSVVLCQVQNFTSLHTTKCLCIFGFFSLIRSFLYRGFC